MRPEDKSSAVGNGHRKEDLFLIFHRNFFPAVVRKDAGNADELIGIRMYISKKINRRDHSP
jgi:hypothetical protein